MSICELRVDGYTRISHVEISDDVCFIPAYASPLGADMLFAIRDDDEHWLPRTLLGLIGVTYGDVRDYVALMRPNLTCLYVWRKPHEC